MSYGCGHDHGAGCNGGVGHGDAAPSDDDYRDRVPYRRGCLCSACLGRRPEPVVTPPSWAGLAVSAVVMSLVLLGILVVGLARALGY